MRNEDTDHRWHLGEILGEIAQILYRLHEHGDAMAIHVATTGLHQRTFRWSQQKMLGQFLVSIGHLKARIIAFHTHLADMMGGYFPKRKEPVVVAVNLGEKHSMARDSTAEMPGQKVKTENGWDSKRAY